MASIGVSGLSLDVGLECTLTLCLETCVCEIVRLGASFADLQFGFLEVFPLRILLFRTRSHLLSGWPLPYFTGICSNRSLDANSYVNFHAIV